MFVFHFLSKDCRISSGVAAVICDAASMSVMIERVGFHSSRWQHIKRDEFLFRYGNKLRQMPGSTLCKNSRMQHAILSLLSISGASDENGSGSVIIDPDDGTSSSEISSLPQIQAHYHINEDDMLLTDDVLMCPFIFRTQDAVLCGALAECEMPGMLRAQFSARNKLVQLEMVYDAMSFMQQLEYASGGKPHIIPNSLETSLESSTDEARVITTAKSPYLIVNVNELWTQTTKYTQMEAKGKELSILHGERTELDAGRRPGKPAHDYSIIAQGKPACCTNIYYDKFGRDFIAFVSSYPVSK